MRARGDADQVLKVDYHHKEGGGEDVANLDKCVVDVNMIMNMICEHVKISGGKDHQIKDLGFARNPIT